MHRSNRAIVTLTMAVIMASAAAGIAAAKTTQECQNAYDASRQICIASPITETMTTYEDVQRCLKRAKTRLDICLANASPPSSLDPGTGTGNPPPKFGAFTRGLLDHGVHSGGQGPAGAGSPVNTAPPVTAAPPSIR